jgi:acetoin utilization protein AcuC
LLVFGPRSLSYDFGPAHPLTPRRFGPGIDLLRTVGAEPGFAPEPATDEELGLCHEASYVAAVRRLSREPDGPPAAGIGAWGDNPSFAGMHEASAAVAGGSMRAMAAILAGDVDHAFHPGGGLHHAMRGRASGFCIYNDPALAIAVARAAGLRVLYVDLDVHHGDGVQALHADDPGVVTISVHETGRALFPGTGSIDEFGRGEAVGSVVNVPLEPGTGEEPWLEAVRSIVPGLAASFGPDLIVSQHGCDTHAWDPLAHLRVTTTAMGAAARLVDRLTHRFASGRWLATGGGGYDAYRVVPRAWSLVWLAGAHRDAPEATSSAWRERWDAEAGDFGTPGMPARFDDPPNAGSEPDRGQLLADGESRRTISLARGLSIPPLARAALDAGWDPLAETRAAAVGPPAHSSEGDLEPVIVELSAELLDRAAIDDRVVAPARSEDARAAVKAVLAAGGVGVGAVVGDHIVGLTLASGGELVALGVVPERRGRGLGTALLGRLMAVPEVRATHLRVMVGPAWRDVVEPWRLDTRHGVARRMFTRAGFTEARQSASLPGSIVFDRPGES